MKSLNQLVTQTKNLVKKFPGPHWNPEVRFVDLVEEIGELANAILVKENHKSKKRQRAELADSLCDCLFNIFMLAEHYKIDLDQEYQQIMKQVSERIKKGDFKHIP
jgi:NTP pyrophosphatase (non-canonical NTP hydrolase)